MEPPSDAEISEYGVWLGLGAEDKELMWIAKQALQTPIPVPWMECETENGDVFYYNTKTRESVWDHPYDAYYKAAICKYKSRECSKDELVDLVSRSWLLSSTDERATSKPPLDLGSTEGHSIRVSISEPPCIVLPATGEPMSPSRLRRRSCDRKNSGGSYSARHEASREAAARELRVLAEAHEATVREMTRDLIKSREYIDALLSENKLLRLRMSEALSKAGQIKDRWAIETRRKDEALSRIQVLEARVHELEIAPPDRPLPLIARLCGCSKNTEEKRFMPLVKEDVYKPDFPSEPSPQNDPYKEIQTLLADP